MTQSNQPPLAIEIVPIEDKSSSFNFNKTFNFENHNIRVLIDNITGEIWFNANDICSVLEFGNARQALVSHVDFDHVQKIDGVVKTEIGRDFSNWIKDRISKLNFVENEDFIKQEVLSSPNLANAKARTQKMIEYWITIDMAKHLCMLENNERGHQARRYFIEIERRYYESKNTNLTADEPKLPLKYSLKFIADEIDGGDRIAKYVGLESNQAILSTCQMIRKLYDIDILSLTEQKGLISESQQHDFSPTEIGGMLKPVQSARKVNQLLIEAGYQTRSQNPKLNRVVYQVTELGKSYAILKDTTKKHSDRTPILQVR